MSTSTATTPVVPPTTGMRKNVPTSLLFLISPANPIGPSGKNWHGTKKAFRPTAGLTSYAKRQELKKHSDAVKELEREMKEEAEAERKARIQRIKDRREAKEEKLRYEKMAEKMHHKRLDRLKRRESATSCSALEAVRGLLYISGNTISPSPPGLHCVYIHRLVEASSFFLVPSGTDWTLIPAWAVRLQAFFLRLGHRSLLASKTNVFL
ncbi:rRNA-processing protein cgrA [Penicillium expansum]|nr:rRNA-processing protein cgrA [Penicillium expansum]